MTTPFEVGPCVLCGSYKCEGPTDCGIDPLERAQELFHMLHLAQWHVNGDLWIRIQDVLFPPE